MQPLKIILEFLSYEGTLTNDPADAVKVKNRVEESNISEISRQKLIFSDGTSDASIQLPDPTCDYLLILIDREVSIKLNGGSEEMTLKPKANGTKALGFFMKGEVTGLTLSNASGAAASVDILSVRV